VRDNNALFSLLVKAAFLQVERCVALHPSDNAGNKAASFPSPYRQCLFTICVLFCLVRLQSTTMLLLSISLQLQSITMLLSACDDAGKRCGGARALVDEIDNPECITPDKHNSNATDSAGMLIVSTYLRSNFFLRWQR